MTAEHVTAKMVFAWHLKSSRCVTLLLVIKQRDLDIDGPNVATPRNWISAKCRPVRCCRWTFYTHLCECVLLLVKFFINLTLSILLFFYFFFFFFLAFISSLNLSKRVRAVVSHLIKTMLYIASRSSSAVSNSKTSRAFNRVSTTTATTTTEPPSSLPSNPRTRNPDQRETVHTYSTLPSPSLYSTLPSPSLYSTLPSPSLYSVLPFSSLYSIFRSSSSAKVQAPVVQPLSVCRPPFRPRPYC